MDYADADWPIPRKMDPPATFPPEAAHLTNPSTTGHHFPPPIRLANHHLSPGFALDVVLARHVHATHRHRRGPPRCRRARRRPLLQHLLCPPYAKTPGQISALKPNRARQTNNVMQARPPRVPPPPTSRPLLSPTTPTRLSAPTRPLPVCDFCKARALGSVPMESSRRHHHPPRLG